MSTETNALKTLYLLRHAKSSWHDPGLNDFERPLNPRGLRNAPIVGSYMAQKDYMPEVIFCSSARRTLETLSLIKPFIGLTTATHVEDGLYLASAPVLIGTAQDIEDSFSSALLIAHNPGLEDCLLLLAHAARSKVPVPNAVPTAALGVFRFEADRWSGIGEGSGALVDFVTPDMLDRPDDP